MVIYLNNGEFFFTPRPPSVNATKIPLVEIAVLPNTIQNIDKMLWPQEARKYHRIETLHLNGKRFEASMKVRGWEKHHWQGDFNSRRRSWRMRIRGAERFNGMKTFNLRRLEFPTYLHGYIPYLIAEELGLLVPSADVVRVHWNGTYYGLMTLWEQLGKAFLKNKGLPEGLIFSNRYTLGHMDLWNEFPPVGEEDKQWRTYPDTVPDERWEPLRTLFSVLSLENDDQFLTEINKILDVESFIRVMAFWNLGGVYSQNIHNIRLYYNPEDKRFEWILWDIAGFHYEVRRFSYSSYDEEDYPLGGSPNLLAYRMLKIPEITEKRNQILWTWMHDKLTRDKFKLLIDEKIRAIKDLVRSEPSRIFPYRFFVDSQTKFKNYIDTRYDFIERELNNLEIKVSAQPGRILLSVKGEAGFRLESIELKNTAIDVSFFRDINQNGVVDSSDLKLDTNRQGYRFTFSQQPLFLPGRRDITRFGSQSIVHTRYHVPDPAHYMILIYPEFSPTSLLIQGHNSITKNSVVLSI